MLPLVGQNLAHSKVANSPLFMAGLIVVPQIVVAILAPWIGYWSEFWGRKPLLLAGFAIEAARAALHVGLRSSPDDGGPIAGWSDGRGCNGVDDPCGHRPHDRHGPLQFGAGGPRHDHWHGGGRQYRLGWCHRAAIRRSRRISADGCDDHRWCRPDLGVPAGNQACQIPRLIAGSLAFGTTAVVVTGEGAWRAPYEATRSNVSCPTQSRNCRNQLRQSAFSSHDRSALSACDRVSLWSETPDRRDRGLLLHKEGSASASFLPAGNTALCRSPRRMMYEKTIQAA